MQWITTNNIESEIWRRILEFANLDFATDEISARHGATSETNTANYRKQAKQIRVCLLQAKEFFDAAKASTLFTSPNHLYYGMLSLSSAIMLVRGNGMTSLDVLRKDKANNHHGLLFSTGINATLAAQGVNLLKDSRVEILDHGHFGNWHNILPRVEPVYGIIKNNTTNGPTLTRMGEVGYQPLKTHSDLIRSRKPLLELLQFIPELSSDLARFGSLNGVWSRVTYELEQTAIETVHSFRIHGAVGEGGLDSILDQFRIPSHYIDLLNCSIPVDNGPNCVVQFRIPKTQSSITIQYPSMRRSSDLSEILYSQEITLPEIAELYLFSYGISMLSRYYPDYWVSCLESHGKAAQIAGRAIEICIQKLPLLALNAMTRNPLTISTYRAPWFS